MPTLVNKADPSVTASFTLDEARAALASGQWTAPGGVPLGDVVTGREVLATPEQLAHTSQHEVRSGDNSARLRALLASAEHEAYSGAGDQLLGAAEGAGSVLSLGLSDLALDKLGADTALREKHTVGRTVGELGALAATALSPFGKGALAKTIASTPAGRIAKFGIGGATPLARVARTAGEGAVWGVAQKVSEIALREPGVVAESTIAELGQGALLGAALGGVFGGLGEGVKAVSKAREARRLARSGPFDLTTGPAREGLDGLVVGFKEVDESIDHAMSNLARNADEAKTTLNAEWSTGLRAAAEQVYTNGLRPRKYLTDEAEAALIAARDAVAGGNQSLEALSALSNQVNETAKLLNKGSKIGPARLGEIRKMYEVGKDVTKNVKRMLKDADDVLAAASAGSVDDVADELITKLRATGDDQHALALLHHARKSGEPGVTEWVDEILGKLKVDADAIEASAAAMKPAMFDKSPVRAILGLRDGEAVTAKTFERLLNLPPQRLIAKAQELGDYYAAAQKAVAGNTLAETRIAEALAAQRQALRKLIPEEANAALNPAAIAGILGITVVPDLSGPTDDVVKMAVIAKLLGGMKGMRLAARKSYAKRIAGAIGRRMMAGGFAGAAASSGLTRGLPVPIRGAMIGGAASGGFEVASWLERTFSKFSSGRAAKAGQDMAFREAVNAAVKQEVAAKARVTGSVDKLATGKPNKYSTGPAMSAVLGILSGDGSDSKATDHEKFKTIQSNLSRFITAPDAVMENAYEALKPMQALHEDIADMAEMTLWQQLEYLYEHMPKDPGTMVKLGESMWQPTDRELFEFTMVATGVVAPFDVLDMIADGFVPPQAAHALAATNPEIFSLAQRELVSRLDEIRENATYNQLIALGLAFQVPLEPTTDPRYVAFVQEQFASQELNPPAPAGGDSKSSSDEYSDAQKLLS